jgi:AcrR family transcriptional regulator
MLTVLETKTAVSRRSNGRGVPATDSKDRPGQDRDEKRAALIRAAVELFSTLPYEDVSVDTLVEKAASAHGMVSYHFGSKRRLFAEAVAAVWTDYVEFAQRRDDETTPSEIVRGYVRRHLEFAQRYPDRFALMYFSHTDRDVDENLERARAEGFKAITARLGCPTDQSALLESAARGWMGFLAGATTSALMNPPPSTEQFVEMCVSVLVAAVDAVNGAKLSAKMQDSVLAEVAGVPPTPDGAPVAS